MNKLKKIGITEFNAKILIAIIVAICGGCTRTIYLPKEMEIIRNDTIRLSSIRTDSVIIQDSISIIEKNDTIRIREVRTRYRELHHTDTIYKTKNDTIRVRESVNQPAAMQNQKVGSWIRKVLTGIGAGVMGAGILTGIIIIVWHILKSRFKL